MDNVMRGMASVMVAVGAFLLTKGSSFGSALIAGGLFWLTHDWK
jgi:hypothetical protein